MEFINSGSVFSQGVKINQYVFCAGARPIDPLTNTPVQGDIKVKVRCVLENIQTVLLQAKASISDVFSMHVYLRNLADKDAVNEIFKEYFQPGKYPVMVVVEANRLIDNLDIEIVCDAYLPQDGEEVQYFSFDSEKARSKGIKIGPYVYCSGVRPIDPPASTGVYADFRHKVRQCFDSLKNVLQAADADMSDIYTTIVCVRNMADRALVNEVTREYFAAGQFPLRVIVEVCRLEEEHELEIECSAYLEEKEILTTKKGQIPTGTFSQGVKIGSFVYCSGVRAIDPQTQKIVVGDFEVRVRRCLDNLSATMAEGGAKFSDVFTTTVYLRNMVDLPVVDKVYREYFIEESYPVRHVVEINRLNEDHDIEIACSAYLNN